MLEELALLKNQVKELRLQDKVGEQNYHQNVKKVNEPMTDADKSTSENLTQFFMKTSIKNNKALESSSEKVL